MATCPKCNGKGKVIKTENSEVTLSGTVYNLLDQDISMYKQGPTSYYAPGINFRAGLFYKYIFPERQKKEKTRKRKRENAQWY